MHTQPDPKHTGMQQYDDMKMDISEPGGVRSDVLSDFIINELKP